MKATLQSLICHLVYTYLAHCITPLFTHATDSEQAEANARTGTGEIIDKGLENQKKLNESAMKFF